MTANDADGAPQRRPRRTRGRRWFAALGAAAVAAAVVAGPGALSRTGERPVVDPVPGEAYAASQTYVGDVRRIAGADRYATAVALTKEAWPDPPDDLTLVIVSGTAFADALMAGPYLQDIKPGAMLPVARDDIPAVVAEELRRLQPKRIVIVGGTAVVSGDVQQELTGYADSVFRVAGADRYSTAVALTERGLADPPEDLTVLVVSGTAFADALMAGPFIEDIHPGGMLAVARDEIPAVVATELRRLRPERIVIVGGAAVVSSAVEAQLGAYADDVLRIAGVDRYSTGAELTGVKWDEPPADLTLVVVSGTAFADALMAGPYIDDIEPGGMLAVARDEVPAVVATELQRLRPERIVIVGGPAVVSGSVAVQLSE